jgi:hypothetical protein
VSIILQEAVEMSLLEPHSATNLERSYLLVRDPGAKRSLKYDDNLLLPRRLEAGKLMKIIYFQCLFHSGAPVKISEAESQRQIRRRQKLL